MRLEIHLDRKRLFNRREIVFMLKYKIYPFKNVT